MRMRLLQLVLLPLALFTGGCLEVEQEGASAAPVDVSGRAVKGIVSDGVVSVYALENGQRRFITQTRTDAPGDFAVTVPSESAPVLLELTPAQDGSSTMVCDAPSGCAGTAFGASGPVPAGLTLSTVVMPGELDRGPLALTPMTHLLAGWAQTLPGGISSQSLGVVRSQFADLTGLPADFVFQSVPDITDGSAFGQAPAASQLHALLAAGYGEIMAQGSFTYEQLSGLFAGQLADNAGQLPELEQGSLDWLLQGAAFVASSLGTSDGDNWATSLATRVQALEGGLTSASPNVTTAPAGLDDALVALDDLDHYLTLAGIDESGTFFATQRAAQLQWLYTDEMTGLVKYTAQTALAAVMASLLGEQLAETANPVDMSSLLGAGASMWYDNTTRELTVSGTVEGQTLDIVIDITPAFDLETVNQLDYAVGGSISNATAVGSLDGTLRIDTYETDFIPVIVAARAMLAGGTEEDLQAFLDAVASLLPEFHARATVDGAGSLVSQSDPANLRFTGAISALAELDMPALQAGNDYLMAEIASGEIVSPAGDTLYGSDGETALRITVGDEARISTDFGFHAFGMPAMRFRGQGSLAGLEEINAALLESLQTGQTTGTLVFDPLIRALAELDPGLFSLNGDGRLDIPADGRIYRFTLENNRVSASLPNSSGEALVFYLTGLNGGYIYSSEGALLATVAIDWYRGGVLLHLAKGGSRAYLAGPITDLVPQELLDMLNQLLGMFSTQ